ncbi:hypothetical protein MNBD_CHLOROFLEXI01-4044 [hydrothermal vent metagenome]|uniref:Uncharacterized protein n=1 Tax=hydrothermal vent metagenome TaxID=652676 RepID=A0A3B0URH7_9ZZZZ
MFVLDQVDLTFQMLWLAGGLILTVWAFVFIVLRKLVARWQNGFATTRQRDSVFPQVARSRPMSAFRQLNHK